MCVFVFLCYMFLILIILCVMRSACWCLLCFCVSRLSVSCGSAIQCFLCVCDSVYVCLCCACVFVCMMRLTIFTNLRPNDF